MVLAGVLSDSDYYYDEEEDNSTKCLDNEFPYRNLVLYTTGMVLVGGSGPHNLEE